jgi:hypothetical protein
MPSLRFPGRLEKSSTCIKKEPQPFIEIKCCPKKPFIVDVKCNPNIYDRAVVRKVPTSEINILRTTFVLETFRGPILHPINADVFCGYNTLKEGDIVAVEGEDLSETCTSPINAIPTKLFTLRKTSKYVIHNSTGTLSIAIDKKGLQYFKFTEVFDQKLTRSTFVLTENRLKFDPIYIYYDVFNLMGVEDANATLTSLLGKNITIKYVDYGEETSDKCGAPIVIVEYTIL